MKTLLYACLLLLAFGIQAENIPVNGKTLSPKTVNFFIHYPDGYDQNRAEGYPVLFFLHGKGEKDTGGQANLDNGTLDMSILNRVLKNGPPKLIANGSWDHTLPFIVVTPQSQTQTGGFSTNNFDPLFNHIVNNVNINPDQLYLTGLSEGAISTYRLYKDGLYNFAAIIPIAGWLTQSISDCSKVKNTAVWAFHGDQDTDVGFNSGVAAYNKVVACAPVHPAKFTAYDNVGHYSWARTYDNTMAAAYDINDPSVDATENLGGDGNYYKQDIYRWLLSFPAAVDTMNEPPLANAGADQAITLPESSVTFFGSGSDSDGSIMSYQWLQTAGPADATMSNTTTDTLTVSDLIEGTYTFSLVVTDNEQATGSDSVNVVVSSTSPPADGSYLQLSNSGYGHIFLQYHFDQSNSLSSRVDVLGQGHNSVEFYLRNIAGSIDYSQLYFGLMGGYQTKELQISPYITQIADSWVKVSIPLVDFGFDAGKLESGVYLVKFRAISALGTGQFGVDEIAFTGGAAPFVYYGDGYTASATDGYSFTGSGFEITDRPQTGGVE